MLEDTHIGYYPSKQYDHKTTTMNCLLTINFYFMQQRY